MSSSESSKTSPMVSLPSIHEMFPDHLLKGIPQHPQQRRGRGSSESNFPARADFSPRMRSTTVGRPPGGGGFTSYAGPMHPYTGRVAPAGSSISPSASHPQQSRPRHAHSTSLGQQSCSPAQFSVLRSDSLSQSLVDISSSATSLPIRGVNPSVRSPNGVASNGSSPPFRVESSSSVPPFDYTSRNLDRHPRRSPITGPLSRPPREIEIPRKSASPPVPYPATIIFPMASAGEAASANEIDDASDDDNSPSESHTGKKHVCPICQKRFNRPSSLRIHLNTHTGATPFRCPWPNCGREFNVNSNMRRHYRNHTTPGFSRAQPNESRRRRRRTAPSVTHLFVEPTGPPSSGRAQHGPYVATPTITTFGTSDSEDDISDSGDTPYSRSHQDKEEDEEDELLDYEMEESGNYHVAASLAQSMERVAVAPERRYVSQSQAHHFATPHSYAAPHHGRRMTPGSGFQSSSSSASPSSSPPSEHRYVPSIPYFHSMGADMRVSTALRPAFHSGRPTGQAVKGERMSEIR